jgi:hypothetical protein
MEGDKFYEAVGKIVPVLLLAAIGVYCILTMVGVPLGILLLGAAIWIGAATFAPRRRGV